VCKVLDKNCHPIGLQIRRNTQGESPKKKAMKLHFSTILSIYTKLDLHPIKQLASSAQFEMDLRLEQSNLFFCDCTISSTPIKNPWFKLECRIIPITRPNTTRLEIITSE